MQDRHSYIVTVVVHRHRSADVLHRLHWAQLQNENREWRGRTIRRDRRAENGMGTRTGEHAAALQTRPTREQRRRHVSQSAAEALETYAARARKARKTRRKRSRRLNETGTRCPHETKVQGKPIQHIG